MLHFLEIHLSVILLYVYIYKMILVCTSGAYCKSQNGQKKNIYIWKLPSAKFQAGTPRDLLKSMPFTFFNTLWPFISAYTTCWQFGLLQFLHSHRYFNPEQSFCEIAVICFSQTGLAQFKKLPRCSDSMSPKVLIDLSFDSKDSVYLSWHTLALLLLIVFTTTALFWYESFTMLFLSSLGWF